MAQDEIKALTERATAAEKAAADKESEIKSLKAAAEKTAADKESEIKALKAAAEKTAADNKLKLENFEALKIDLQKAAEAKQSQIDELNVIALEQNAMIDSLSTKASMGNAFVFKKIHGIDYEVRLKSFNHNGQILKAEELQDEDQVLKDLLKLKLEWLVPLNAPQVKKGKNS